MPAVSFDTPQQKMCLKSSSSILLAIVLLCISLNESLADSFFENITKKSLLLNLDKSCPLTADVAKHNRDKLNAVPKLDDVSFELRSPCKGQRFTMSEAGKLRQDPAFNVDKKTVALITSHIDEAYVQLMAEAFNCRHEYNFLAIDTSNFLNTDEYVSSAINVEELGAHIATGLHNSGIDSENIHLIGHNLGAHTAGSAGFNYAKTGGEKIARITGLDPARPCFKSGAIRSLNHDDATFVDVIHGNPGLLGLEDPVGDADFYPGGLELIKPGCDEHFVCSQDRAVAYFTESVIPGNDNNFIATKCNGVSDVAANTCSGSKLPMGIGSDKDQTGIYSLSVKASSPYGENATAGSTKPCEVCSK